MRISDWSSDVCSSDLSRRCVRAGSVWRVTAGTPCRRAGRDRAGLAFELRTHHACSALSEGAQPLHGRLRDHRPVELPSEPGTARISIGGSSRRSEEHTSELQSLMRISYAVFCLKK